MNDEIQMERNRQQWVAEQQSRISKPPQKRLPLRNIILALIGFAILVPIFTAIVSNSKSPQSAAPAPSNSAESAILSEHDEAQEHAKSFILKTLKAPDSAKFPPHSEIKAVKVNGMWEVETYVDAQNSFGAMIRTPYHLKMENQGSLWRLAYIGQEKEQSFIPAAEPTVKPAEEKQIHRSVDKDGNPVFSDNQQ